MSKVWILIVVLWGEPYVVNQFHTEALCESAKQVMQLTAMTPTKYRCKLGTKRKLKMEGS